MKIFIPGNPGKSPKKWRIQKGVWKKDILMCATCCVWGYRKKGRNERNEDYSFPVC